MSGIVVIEQVTYLDQDRTAQDEIRALVHALASHDGSVREGARRLLVRIGPSAVEDLIQALADPRDQVRWEAAEALGRIRDARTGPAFVRALDDPNGGVRWIAVSALSALGPAALSPLLKALMEHSESYNLRAGAHHILRLMAHGDLREILTPVQDALDGPACSFEVPVRAHTALHALRGEADHRLA